MKYISFLRPGGDEAADRRELAPAHVGDPGRRRLRQGRGRRQAGAAGRRRQDAKGRQVRITLSEPEISTRNKQFLVFFFFRKD